MKQKYTIGFIALVLTIALAGCVHDYPGMTEEIGRASCRERV